MRVRLVVLLAIVLLAVAACGDDSGDDTASDDAASASVDVGDESDDATSDDADGGDDAADDSDAADAADDGDDAVDFGDIDFDALCSGDVSAALDAASAFGGLDTGSVDFGSAADLYDNLAASGPSELSDDFAVLADALRQLDEVYGDLDLSDPASLSSPEVLADLEAAFSGLDQEALTEAAENINVWYTETCL